MMATRKFRKFSEGGEAADKEEGLKASKDEKVGFLERMRMGNIDDEKSEAYRRFGAGRAKADRDEKNEAAAMKAVDLSRASAAKTKDADDEKPSKTSKMDELEEANQRDPIFVANGPRADQPKPGGRPHVNVQTAKPAAKPTAKPDALAKSSTARQSARDAEAGQSRGRREDGAPKTTVSSSKPAKSLVDQIPLDAPRTPVKGEKIDSTELGRNINNALNATPGIQVVGRMKSAGQAAQKAGSRALSTADDGVTYLGKSGRRQVGGFDEVGSSGARQLANNPTRQLAAPSKQLTGPSKSDLVNRDRAARQAKRRSEMGEENASRYGLDPKSSDYAERAKSIRDNIGGDDFSLGMKRGGKVKPSQAKPSAKGWGMARGARAAKMR
jgi:hypothetical protein